MKPLGRLALPLATATGALVSALLFTRAGLRPWEALPVGAAVQLGVYLALRAVSRRGS